MDETSGDAVSYFPLSIRDALSLWRSGPFNIPRLDARLQVAIFIEEHTEVCMYSELKTTYDHWPLPTQPQ